MSVAFRRESDDEHLEPKFERPIPPGPNRVTRTGLAALERAVAEADRAVTLVGSDEADGRTRIAFSAPLARALMGAMAGERVAFAGRADAIEVLAVEND